MAKNIITLIFLIVSLLVVLKVQSFVKNNRPEPVPTNVICTADAMMCPDGSYVGRTGPMCEFKCPEPISIATTTVTLSLNQPFEISSTTIIIKEVLEDSRCPQDVVCIQAGRLLANIELITPTSSSTLPAEIGEWVSTDKLTVTLVDVNPYPSTSSIINDQDYRFSLSITGKNNGN